MLRRTLLGGAVLAPLALSACATTERVLSPIASALGFGGEALPRDPHSHARPEIARVTHVSLDLEVDFERKVLSGTATLDIQRRDDADELVLDVDTLVIKGVRTNVGEPTWRQTAHGADLGNALRIPLWPGANRVVIEYETSPAAGALQWLAPEQTASRKPFLFSQGQSILTRTWIPTQDSPGIRQTYDARITVPDGLKALMGADMTTRRGRRVRGGKRQFRFSMDKPIPPYLIALAVGDVEFRRVGRRTGVYAEPSVVEAAATEFSDMERMLETAEDLYGGYRWGRYDVLVLPSSFPYGGMENPKLTFATPTIIAGDKSLVSLIAHELAHSWSGNLVTNAVWADFWLNESFTTYFEGRITEALYGADFAAMQNVLAWADIQTAIANEPADSQRLHLRGERGAEDYVSAIAYEKGALFLRTIERTIGRQRWDAYLRSYFDRHAFQPMTTERFLADFRNRLVRGDDALEQSLQLDTWVFEPGLPSNAQEPRADGFEEVAHFAADFAAGGVPASAPWENWGTMQRQRYLQTLPRELPRERLDALESSFALNSITNSEVLFDWLSLALRNRYEPALAPTESFLTSMGRGKFVRPLYRTMMDQGDWGQPHARRIYALARAGYHPITQGQVDRIVTPAT